jgi:hypothetical protein
MPEDGTIRRMRMKTKMRIGSAGRGLAYGAGLAAGVCAAYVGLAWLRYGHAAAATGDAQDPLLDRFMPAYDVVDRHHVPIAAPADVAFAAACEIDLQQSAIIQAIFTGRELLLRSAPDTATRPPGLVEWTKTMGWGVLAEVPGREIVVAASPGRGTQIPCSGRFRRSASRPSPNRTT